MRYILGLGLLIVAMAPADAATLHRSGARHHVATSKPSERWVGGVLKGHPHGLGTRCVPPIPQTVEWRTHSPTSLSRGSRLRADE